MEGFDATFNVVIRLQSGRDPRRYFRINYLSFKQKTGTEIAEGGFYRIGIKTELGSFQKVLRSMSARQDIPFYVPKWLQDRLEIGKQYNVTVDWIEKIPKPNDWRSGVRIDVSDWTWREFASWVDTEGTIHTGGHTRYLAVGQKDCEVVRHMCAFLDKEGIKSSMRLDVHTGVYYAMVYRVDDIAKIVKNVEPYIRTENKKMEIRAFKDDLKKPRSKLRTSIIRARETLGIVAN